MGSPRRLGRHPRDHPERAARSAPYPAVLAAREPHAAPARPRCRHPRVDADLGGQPGVGVPFRRGRGRLPRVGRRRADGHGPGVRAGQGLRGDRAILDLRVHLGPDPRALLGPRGARAGRARGGLDDHAGRRGVTAGPARPRFQGQGLPGRAHRHEPRNPRGRRGRVDHLGGVPGGLARSDHRHLRYVER